MDEGLRDEVTNEINRVHAERCPMKKKDNEKKKNLILFNVLILTMKKKHLNVFSMSLICLISVIHF